MIITPAMKMRALKVGMLGALTLGLAACGGGGGSGVTLPGMAARFEDMFGTNFGIYFRAGANTDPGDPQPGDIIPLTLTADPVDF